MKSETNKNISQIFGDMAAIYRYMGDEERFRSGAYKKAAKVVGSLSEDVSVYIKNNSLNELPGIGESMAEKILEFVNTGKIKLYEQLKKSVPYKLMGMMEIKGFGPRSLRRIHEQLKITTKDELIQALKDGSIENLKKFGQKKTENLLRGLKLHKTIEERILLWDALEAGENIIQWMQKIPEVKQAELAGSLRRGKETIGDIDILVSGDEKTRTKIVAHFTSAEIAKQILAKGDTKASIILKNSGRQADLRIVNEDEWGSALQYFTGSKEHNIHLRTIAKEKGYKISEYGIFSIKNNKKIAGGTEEEIYRTLGFQLIPPEMREDTGEIELAAQNKIPKLVSLQDIKGDLHTHSLWSDGLNTMEEIVNHVRKNFGYQYLAITDHSISSRIAKGMDEKQILKQIKVIGEINKKLGENYVKTGLEVDILPNGNLDISDEILSQLDWVNASIHSNFNRDNTDRIMLACENPNVHCIGHPTGRIIGSREAYKVDMVQIIETAKHTNTAIEINAQPNRMDLSDELATQVRKDGVKIVISTDSHSLGHFNFMKLGVIIARRAWCKADTILNTKSWEEIERFKKNKIKTPQHVM